MANAETTAATDSKILVAAGKLFREKGWKTLIVVTTPAHSKRAAAVIEQQGIEVISVPATETR